jgi:hypothetical protein
MKRDLEAGMECLLLNCIVYDGQWVVLCRIVSQAPHRIMYPLQ